MVPVKSGKDYTIHRALDRFLANPSYPLNRAYVLSNERLAEKEGKIIYLPIYYVMFLSRLPDEDERYFQCFYKKKPHIPIPIKAKPMTKMKTAPSSAGLAMPPAKGKTGFASSPFTSLRDWLSFAS